MKMINLLFRFFCFSLLVTQPVFSQLQRRAAVKADTAQVSVAPAPLGIRWSSQGLLKEDRLRFVPFDSTKFTSQFFEYRLPFTALFKYDTSPNNPEHRCYEITRPLTERYLFLFNFMSQKKYRVGEQ